MAKPQEGVVWFGQRQQVRAMEKLSERYAKLNNDCRKLYANRPRHITAKMIAENCEVSESFLTQWSKGDLKEPAIVKLECIHDYLITNGSSIVI